MTALIDSRCLPYVDVPGTQQCRQTCAAFVNTFYSTADRKFSFSHENVIVTTGGIQAIFNCLSLSIEGASDVVLTTKPAYGLYSVQTHMLGGVFDTIDTCQERMFVPSAGELEAAFARHSRSPGHTDVRCLVLCFPNNPTGATLSAEQALELATCLDGLLAKYPSPGFSVVLDEVYLGITTGAHVSLLQFASPRLLQSLLLILSASKGLGAMPGARAAWVTAPHTQLVAELVKVQVACTGNSSSVSQAGLSASLKFLMENPCTLHQVSAYYGDRTSLVVERLTAVAQLLGLGSVCCLPPGRERPDGTFYVWACFRELRKQSKHPAVDSDVALVQFLRSRHAEDDEHVGVACVPGSAFRMEPSELYVRFSCARDDLADLEAAVAAVGRGLGALIAHTG